MNYIISKLPEERERFGELLSNFTILEEPPEHPEPGSKLFFYHYSKKVPPELYQNFHCIGFHMTDLPFGRGGSPIQNLISLGYTNTVLTSFEITENLDAGGVYYKVPISLDGTIMDILLRGVPIAANTAKVISEMKQITAMLQTGEKVYFKQFAPAQSIIGPDVRDVRKFYDKIRMLDGTGYPPAFIESGLFRYEFSEAKLKSGILTATVHITLANK